MEILYLQEIKGPIVQRIVCGFPEPKIQVRFLVGLLKEKRPVK